MPNLQQLRIFRFYGERLKRKTWCFGHWSSIIQASGLPIEIPSLVWFALGARLIAYVMTASQLPNEFAREDRLESILGLIIQNRMSSLATKITENVRRSVSS
jgi:hypothetical protein